MHNYRRSDEIAEFPPDPRSKRLEEWTRRPTTAQSLALRARIILAADGG